MDKIGRFEIVGEIGRGAMGRVYKGRDPSSGQLAAVKVLYEATAKDEVLATRFRDEARILSLMSHPAITHVYEVGEYQTRPYLAMEYLEGEDLGRILRKRTELPIEKKVDIVRRVAEGLDYAHKRGVVHRDIKPSNIRLLPDGAVKIMDFGVARMHGSETKSTGHIMGTIDYVSPEQLKGLEVDGRGDLFSLACVLYALLTGRRPFESDNLTAMMFKIMHEETAPIEEVRGTPHEWLSEVISRCLQKDPAQRFQSCGDLAEMLRAGLTQRRPSTLGRFEVLSTLGEGTTGVILKVRDPEDDRIYALRKIDVFQQDAFRSLRRIVKDASRVGHPAIVKVREFGSDHNLPYLVMDYVEGESLRDRLAGGEVQGIDASVDLVRQLLVALEAAHNQGIVHGEVDPSNIMVTAAAEVRLLGFGLGELRDPSRGPEIPRVCYYAPEKIDGEKPDRRGDIYSVGVVLYQLLSGQLPFDGDDPYDVMQRIVFKPAPTLEPVERGGGLLNGVLEKALAKAPERRYATAYQMALDLDRYRIGRTSATASRGSASQGAAKNSDDAGKAFDVFLCHSFTDKPTVRELSAALTRGGLRPWLDEEQLRPGLPWQELLEAQIEDIKAVAVIVGASGLGPWQDMELRAFLDEFVKRRCPVIPVLLKSCPTEPKLPIFLSRMTWVDFRTTDPDPMAQLVWGITGKRPAPDDASA